MNLMTKTRKIMKNPVTAMRRVNTPNSGMNSASQLSLVIEDATNKNCLAKLLRVETTKSDGKLTSLDQYISRMKPGQKDIFYITGTSKEQLEKSPFLERVTKKNYEVCVCPWAFVRQ